MLPCGWGETQVLSLLKQQVLLTTEPSLQPQGFIFSKVLYDGHILNSLFWIALSCKFSSISQMSKIWACCPKPLPRSCLMKSACPKLLGSISLRANKSLACFVPQHLTSAIISFICYSSWDVNNLLSSVILTATVGQFKILGINKL